MAEHISTFDEDGDGWPSVSCSCGWSSPPLPDMETAADVWGDHRAAMAIAETAAPIADAARAAARPDREPLWRTKTLELSTRSKTSSMITHHVFDLPPGTAVRVDKDTT